MKGVPQSTVHLTLSTNYTNRADTQKVRVSYYNLYVIHSTPVRKKVKSKTKKMCTAGKEVARAGK
jgi:hypothetical protein